MDKDNLDIPMGKIIDYCKKWQVKELAVFGSVLRDDFSPDSDIDFLVTFEPDARRTLFDLVRMKKELEDMLGREVDLVSRRGVESARNPISREAILKSAETIYAA